MKDNQDQQDASSADQAFNTPPDEFMDNQSVPKDDLGIVQKITESENDQEQDEAQDTVKDVSPDADQDV